MSSMDSEAKWTLAKQLMTDKQWRRIDLRRQGKSLADIAKSEGVSIATIAESIGAGQDRAKKYLETLW